MKTTKRSGSRLGAYVAVALMLVLVFAAPLAAVPNYETRAYYSVVRDDPSAAFTASDELQRTSVVPYYSVVRDAPAAPFTDPGELQRTSLVPYFSVVH